MIPIRLPQRGSIRVVLLFAVAAVLLLALIGTTGLSWSRFAELWTAVSPLAFVCIMLASGVQMLCGAWKWRIVTQTVAPDTGAGGSFFLFYTTLGAVLGQFMPIHLSSAVARGGALRMHHGVQLSTGAATSVYEQLFDLIVPALLAPVALLAITAKLSVTTWLLMSLACLVVGGYAVTALSTCALGQPGVHGVRPGFFVRLRSALETARQAGLFERRIVMKMLSLSMLRYLAHLARVLLIAWALGLNLDLIHIAQLLPLMQLALVLAFTPGSLGIAEWTWVGILAVTGVGLAPAGEFALMHRLLLLASLIGVLAPCGLLFLIQSKKTRAGVKVT